MKTSILQPGEHIHLVHRRRFEKDIRRHFVGTVEACENGVVRASGYVFVIDELNQHLFTKRPDRRTKLIPLASGDVIVNVLPDTLDIEQVRYELDGRKLWVTDGNGWKMDVKEFGWGGARGAKSILPKETMKLTLQHFCVRSTDQLDGWVESRILSLQERLQIDEANVRLECCFQNSPPFAVRVHLVTPGPDVLAEGRDHTLRAAFGKVMAQLEEKSDGREMKRTQRLHRRLNAPAGRSRRGSPRL